MRKTPEFRPEEAARRLGRELSALGLVLRLTGIGWYVAVCIVGGTLLGYWADGGFETRPWLTLVGLAVGIAVAFSGMISMLRAVLASGNRDTPESDGDG
jgi:F0F1-type ATP synthase assembly protein I